MIYLDNNATTAIHPEVLKEMMPFFTEQHGNPTSNHRFGRRAHTAIEEAREKVAYAVNAHPSQIVFTASGTESNNTIFPPEPIMTTKEPSNGGLSGYMKPNESLNDTYNGPQAANGILGGSFGSFF